MDYKEKVRQEAFRACINGTSWGWLQEVIEGYRRIILLVSVRRLWLDFFLKAVGEWGCELRFCPISIK